ncbi:MAG: hypothetical protein JHD16_05795 [Solirubrobacteraceae bacterium]|nr:hypothetical protein [Solirubrobacteraceae bacterium]
MSRVPTLRRHDGGASRSRSAASRLLMLIAAFAVILGFTPVAALAADPTGAKATRSDLCRAWDAPADNPEITLDGGQKVAGDTRQRIGENCEAPKASVLFTQAAIDTNPAGSGPAGTAAARVLAAVTQAAAGDPELGEGTEVFKGAYLRNFQVQIYFGYTYVRGTLDVQWSGGKKSSFQFSGNIYTFEKFRLNVWSPAGGTLLPNVDGDPVSFSGSLFYNNGKYTFNVAGEADNISLGQGEEKVAAKDARLRLSLVGAGEGQHLKLTVAGKIGIGSTVWVDGNVAAEFDANSLKSVYGVGEVLLDFPAKDGVPAGELDGKATFRYSAEPLSSSVTFSGAAKLGDTLVTSAKGALDDRSLSFTGNASYTSPELALKGAVDGVAFFGEDLTGLTVEGKSGQQVPATKGDYLLKTASGEVTAKGLKVKGNAQLGSVGADQWAKAAGEVDTTFQVGNIPETTIAGSATVDWAKGTAPAVTFKGSVESGSTLIAGADGSVDGNKLDLKGNVTLANPDLEIKGAIDGVFFYGTDLAGQKVKNRQGNDVDASRGDFVLRAASASIKTNGFELSGNAQLGRVGSERWASGGGAVDLTYAGTNLKGEASMTWIAGQLPAVAFDGAVSSGSARLAGAKGKVDGNKLELAADATLTVNGLTVAGAVDGVVYYGDDLAGQKVKNFAGDDVQAQKGDFLVKSASADVDSNGFSLKGETSLGKAGSELWAKGGGSVDLTYGTTNLKGSATAEWKQGAAPSVAFDGSLTSGTTTVANASGTFDGNKISIQGDAAYSGEGLELAGAVNGTVYYGNDLSGEKVKNRNGDDVTPNKGDFVLTSAAGSATLKGLTVAGVVSISKVAGDTWATAGGAIDVTVGGTTIKGSADIAWAQGQAPAVAFEGSVETDGVTIANAKGFIDGNKVEFEGGAQLAIGGVAAKGAVDGVVFYGSDLAGETIKNRAGNDVTPSKGDFLVKSASGEVVAQGITASGNVSVGKIGSELWVKGGGAIDLTIAATEIKGSAQVDWVKGSTPAVTFAGSVKTDGIELVSAEGSFDGSKIALKAQGQLAYNGISVKGAVDGVVFYGNDLAGQKIKNRAGNEVQASKGDINVTSASADVAANGFSLKGEAGFGKVGGELWAKGGGSVDLTYGATNLKGSATADWVMGQVPAITFAGSLTNGTTTVANVSGAFDGNKIALKGDATVTDPALTLGGSVDGVLYYGNDLSAEKVKNRAGADVTPAKGDYVLKSAAGNLDIKGLKLSGNLSLAKVAGETWATAGGSVDATYGATTVKGTASVSWVQGQTPSVTFDGSIASGDLNVASAKGTIDGNKIDFQGNASLVTSGLSVKGAVDGVVFYGSDLSGQKIKNRAGADVQATKGDFLVRAASGEIITSGITASGAVSAGKVGTQVWAKGGGAIDLTVGTTNVKGSADIDWVQGSTPAVNFTGAIKSDGIELASATGSFDGSKIALKASGQLTYNGISVKGAVDGVVFYGNDLAGQKIKNRAGNEVQASKGDINVTSASADLAANGFSLKGETSFGKVGSEIWVKGGGSVDLTYGTTNLKGSATADWVLGQVPAITFAGTLTSGTTTVAGASGTFDGNKIALKGNASFTDPALTIGGSVDGVLYYGNDLSAEKVKNRAGADVTPAKGDYVLKSAAGNVSIKGLALSGNVSLAKVAGEMWATAGGSIDATYNGTTIKGSASVAWVQGQAPSVSFDGSLTSGGVTIASAKGTIDGNKIAFAGSAQLSGSGISAKGAIDGVVFYGSDLTGEKVTNRAGTLVQATRGDFYVKSASGEIAAKGITAKGAVSMGKVGTQYWAKGGGSVDLTFGTTNVKGSADIDWVTGQVPSVTFAGAVKSGDIEVASASGTVDGKKIALKAAGQLVNSNLSLKGTVDVIVFYGDDLTGETIANRAGTQVPATKGDINLKGASVDIVAKGFTLKGNASFGKVGTQVWAKGGGNVDLTYGATKLVGSADVDWVMGQVPAVNFAGSLTNGNAFVGSASGTVDGKKIALKGQATINDPAGVIKGAVDGVFFYGDSLAGEKIENRAGTLVEPLKGDYNLKGASGSIDTKGLQLAGNISMGNVRGDRWVSGGGSVDMRWTQNGVETRLQGQAAASVDGTVTFSGSISQGDLNVASVSGTVDGNKLTFEGQLSTPTMSGQARGTIYYGNNLAGQTITNKAGTAVQAQKGDFSFEVTNGRLSLKQLLATAEFSVKRVGADWWVNAAAQIKTGDNWLTFTGSIDSNWNFNLKGAGVITMDGYRLEFNGTALLRDNRLVLDGTVNVVTNMFSVQLTGTIEKPNMDVNQYAFYGRASFKFGGYQIANASVKLVFGEGLITTFDIKICILFICPNGQYKLYFQGGNISKIQLNVPIIYWAQFSLAATIAAPGVPLESKITGIF